MDGDLESRKRLLRFYILLMVVGLMAIFSYGFLRVLQGAI